MRLTLRTIGTLSATAKEFIEWDDELPGFGVRVKPSGVKSYVLQYRNADGQSRRKTIGRHGIQTVEEARKAARQLKAAVEQGKDPAADTRARRNAPNIDSLCERYFDEHAKVHKKPRSAKEDRRMIDKRIKPAIGTMKAAAVTQSDIMRLHHALRQTPYEANRVLALLSKMFKLAELWGLRPPNSNPVLHVKRFAEKKREGFLGPEELGRLGAALSEADQTREIHPTLVAGIRLLLLTGCRLSEVVSLQWALIDFEAGTIRLPDSKTGAKTIYLGEAALDVLAKLPRQSNYVLPGIKDPEGPLSGATLDHAWRRVREKVGLQGYRLHDLRHTFASWAVNGGASLPITGALLGHREMQTTQRYAHLSRSPLKKAANEVTMQLQQAIQAGCK
ncbi:MAG: site-specific integrase [Kiloniellaceae bacterium]